MKPVAILYATAGMAAIGAGGFVAWKIYSEGATIGEAAAQLGDKINPASPNNIAAQAVNSVVQAVTGEPDATLGTKLWEWFHPAAVAAEAHITDPVAISRPGAGGQLSAGAAAALDLSRAMLDDISLGGAGGSTEGLQLLPPTNLPPDTSPVSVFGNIGPSDFFYGAP